MTEGRCACVRLTLPPSRCGADLPRSRFSALFFTSHADGALGRVPRRRRSGHAVATPVARACSATGPIRAPGRLPGRLGARALAGESVSTSATTDSRTTHVPPVHEPPHPASLLLCSRIKQSVACLLRSADARGTSSTSSGACRDVAVESGPSLAAVAHLALAARVTLLIAQRLWTSSELGGRGARRVGGADDGRPAAARASRRRAAGPRPEAYVARPPVGRARCALRVMGEHARGVSTSTPAPLSPSHSSSCPDLRAAPGSQIATHVESLATLFFEVSGSGVVAIDGGGSKPHHAHGVENWSLPPSRSDSRASRLGCGPSTGSGAATRDTS